MKRYFPTALALAITAVFVVLAIRGLSWTDSSFLSGMGNNWLDAKFRWRGELTPEGDVLIVALDERSLNALGSANLFQRSHHAALVDRLSEYGARVVAFDIIFEEPDPTSTEPGQPSNDELFAAAMERAGNVVMAIAIDIATIGIGLLFPQLAG